MISMFKNIKLSVKLAFAGFVFTALIVVAVAGIATY